jgi:hypothetical protein
MWIITVTPFKSPEFVFGGRFFKNCESSGVRKAEN